MHYIRFMRAPALARSGKRLLLELVLTINTDLSDAYLHPSEPVDVMVYAQVLASSSSPSSSGSTAPLIYVLAGPGQIVWRSGLRVLKPTIDVPASVQTHLRAGHEVRICASAKSSISASGVAKIVGSLAPGHADDRLGQGQGQGLGLGQIMPAYFMLHGGGRDGHGGRDGGKGDDGDGDGGGRDVDLGMRRLVLDEKEKTAVEFEEELGESMARHIWDGGVVALCKAADACLSGPRRRGRTADGEEKRGREEEKEEEKGGTDEMESHCMDRLKELITGQKHVNVLELGCGIGVLGVGLAAVFSQLHLRGQTCSILMTDLEDAGPRARANMARLETSSSFPSSSSSSSSFFSPSSTTTTTTTNTSCSPSSGPEHGRSLGGGPAGPRSGRPVDLAFEELDWEDGRLGRLGEVARSRRWDLVMVADCTYNTDTLPALVGTLNAVHASNQGHEAGRASRLFLATKNRHDSEREVYGLLRGQGWEVLGREVVMLPVMGDDAQTVELYMFEKL